MGLREPDEIQEIDDFELDEDVQVTVHFSLPELRLISNAIAKYNLEMSRSSYPVDNAKSKILDQIGNYIDEEVKHEEAIQKQTYLMNKD